MRKRRRLRGGSGIRQAGLTAWYDTSDANYLTLASTAITRLLDKSGNGYHTDVQGTATARATLTANQSNGLQAAVLDGGDYYKCNALASIGLADHTIVIVAKPGVHSATGELVSWQNQAVDGDANQSKFEIDVNGFYQHTAVDSLDFDAVNHTGKAFIAVNTVSATDITCRINGAAATTISRARPTVLDSFSIGQEFDDTTPSNFYIGAFCEFIVYNRILTANEIQQIEIALSYKWGVYHPSANWINNYTPWQRMLINAWGINKDDAFTNTVYNPFAVIYDPTLETIGSVPSLTDRARGINTATEVTNPPVNTAGAIGSTNGLLYNGTTTILNSGSDSTIDNIFAAGGSCIAVIKPTDGGEGGGGRIFDKNNTQFQVSNESGGSCKLTFTRAFSVTTGQWTTNSTVVPNNAVSVVAVTYDSSNVLNDPSIYANNLTPKAITENSTPTLTPTSDAASNFILGNSAGGTRTFNGYFGKLLVTKSVPTTAQLNSVMTFLANEAGVSLS